MATREAISNKLREIGGNAFADKIITALKTEENINRLAAYISAHSDANKSDIAAFVDYEKENVEMPR